MLYRSHTARRQPIRLLLAIVCLLGLGGCAQGWRPAMTGSSAILPQTLGGPQMAPPAPMSLTTKTNADSKSASTSRATVRGQTPRSAPFDPYAGGSNEYARRPMPGSGNSDPNVQPAQYQPGSTAPPGPGFDPPPGFLSSPEEPPVDLESAVGPDFGDPLPGTPVPIDVEVQEARTGQFTIGVGVNSDAGVTGQVILDERNFDATRLPTSWNDFANGTAFRGAGQGFRVEAIPGNQVQRYLVSFTEPYLFDTQVSLNLSGFFYDRRFFDWDEQRLGGRVGLGYRITPDLSFSTALRMENVNIHDPRVLGIPELDDVIGDNSLFSPRFTLTHDTRDIPFAPTEGHYIELAYEQVFGSFDYPRGELDFRKYFLVTERPDGSGRHTLAYSFGLGFSGSQTPIFENFFAGGYSTIRGFDFRGASPVKNTVVVGGQFRMLGSVEYFFPLTADDMLKGVVFCDFGTVEEEIAIHGDDYRVAPGFGLRIQVPALGPAPIALDLAVPVAREDTDNIQNFSFFFGFNRS
jgi:outer membrane protein insertion porin family